MLFFRGTRISIQNAFFFHITLPLIRGMTCSMAAAQQNGLSSATAERRQIDLWMGKDTAAAEHATFSVVP